MYALTEKDYLEVDNWFRSIIEYKWSKKLVKDAAALRIAKFPKEDDFEFLSDRLMTTDVELEVVFIITALYKLDSLRAKPVYLDYYNRIKTSTAMKYENENNERIIKDRVLYYLAKLSDENDFELLSHELEKSEDTDTEIEIISAILRMKPVGAKPFLLKKYTTTIYRRTKTYLCEAISSISNPIESVNYIIEKINVKDDNQKDWVWLLYFFTSNEQVDKKLIKQTVKNASAELVNDNT
jgi:hypothetical protein